MSDRIDLRFDLYELPTAQHRAGLAGLLLVLDTLERRGVAGVPTVSSCDGLVELSLDQAGLSLLFDEVYDATTEEARQYTQRKNRAGQLIEPLRVVSEVFDDPKSGKPRTRTVYYYPQVVPRLRPLVDLEVPPVWLKLWRDALWQTLRAVPKTRLPFEQRAAGKPAAEAAATWKDLQQWRRDAAKGRSRITPVASSILLGAQSENAEQVPFVGRPDQTLLLHFWTLVMGVGEAWAIEVKGGESREVPNGYVLSVPDVADLEGFVDDFKQAAAQLSPELQAYRPRDAVVSLPQEGALEYLHQLGRVVGGRARQGQLAYSVAGVEVYHLIRRGNSVVALGAGRIAAKRPLLQQYEQVRARYRNLLFRARLIGNLLRGEPWYRGFERLFDTANQDLFFGGSGASFAGSARRRLFSDSQPQGETQR